MLNSRKGVSTSTIWSTSSTPDIGPDTEAMWQQLTIRVRSADAEPLEDELLAAGAVSISYLDAEDQPVFQEEPGSTPLWDNSVLLALFEQDTILDELLERLRDNSAIANAATLAVEQVKDQAWERSWMESFQPIQFGKNLWVCPSWQEPPEPAATNILMDPGLAFGSGSHNTTALCLQWLEQAELQGKTVIDYGCGSGILAIGAALLGAERVIAVDNDPQAVLATLDNSQRNGLDLSHFHTYLPEALPESLFETPADILIANILAAPLIELAPHFMKLLSVNGKLVLSGLLDTQIEDVMAAYSQWIEFSAPTLDAEWVRLDGTRKA